MPVALPPQPRRLGTLVLAVIGGLVTDSAFPQRGLWPLAAIGVALLVLAVRRDSARWAFVVGLTWGLSFFLVHIWWAHEAVGIIPWVALSLAQAIAIGLSMSTWIWISRSRLLVGHPWLGALGFAVAWTTWEIGRSAGPFGGFPWGRLAFSQTEGPLLRLASLGGTTLVTAIVAATGYVLALGWLRLRTRHVSSAAAAFITAMVIPALCLAIPLNVRAEQGVVSVGVVQGNVSEPGLGAFNNAREVITNHADGTVELAQTYAGELDVVLWPENAADYDPRTDEAAREAVEAASQAIGAPILLGTQSYQRDGNGVATGRFNDFIRWDPGVGEVASYAKQHPAPFAEYIPMRDIARRFSSAVDLVSVDMIAGQSVGILPVPVDGRDVPFGIAICFEVAYDAIVRESVAQGAEVLIVPTNNASFGVTAESEQQLAMTVFRAVEHGRAAVQVSTVGVSAVVTPNGVVKDETELFTPAAFTADLPLRTSQTLATQLGDIPQWIAFGATLFLTVLGVATWSRSRSRRATMSAPRRRAAK